MSETFMRDVMGRQWRGIVRELRSYLEQAVVLSDAGILDAPISSNTVQIQTAERGGLVQPLQAVVEGAERNHISCALAQYSGSVGKTANALGISRKTLWEKMKKLAIKA